MVHISGANTYYTTDRRRHGDKKAFVEHRKIYYFLLSMESARLQLSFSVFARLAIGHTDSPTFHRTENSAFSFVQKDFEYETYRIHFLSH